MDIIVEIIIKTSQESEETDWKMQTSSSYINKNSISSKLGKTAPWVDQAVDRFSEAVDRPVDRLPDLVDCLVDQGTRIFPANFNRSPWHFQNMISRSKRLQLTTKLCTIEIQQVVNTQEKIRRHFVAGRTN